jgi:rubredoxin
MIKRSIECDVCGWVLNEAKDGAGWPGWGQINGVNLNGVDNPNLCGMCLSRVMDFVDNMENHTISVKEAS